MSKVIKIYAMVRPSMLLSSNKTYWKSVRFTTVGKNFEDIVGKYDNLTLEWDLPSNLEKFDFNNAHVMLANGCDERFNNEFILTYDGFSQGYRSPETQTTQTKPLIEFNANDARANLVGQLDVNLQDLLAQCLLEISEVSKYFTSIEFDVTSLLEGNKPYTSVGSKISSFKKILIKKGFKVTTLDYHDKHMLKIMW